MRYILLLSVIFLSSCREEYKNIDPQKFNKQISHNANIKTAADLIYAYDTTLVRRIRENTARLSVTSKVISNTRSEITAIIDIYDDDEVKAEKLVMAAESQGNYWHVFEIRHNWKNRQGYGHADWGI